MFYCSKFWLSQKYWKHIIDEILIFLHISFQFLTLICWATMADIMGGYSWGRGGFLIFTTIVPWIVFIVVLILIILKLTAQLSQVPWSLAVSAKIKVHQVLGNMKFILIGEKMLFAELTIYD